MGRPNGTIFASLSARAIHRIAPTTSTMKILYFDPFNGASGDMILGALIHLGVPLEHLRGELARLDLKGYELVTEEIERQGLSGIDFQVRTKEGSLHKGDAARHPQDHHSHRHLTQIQKLIQESRLNPWVKEKSLAIFQRLGEAEAKVHRIPLEKVHFHEVGAIDSIIDIVGACIGFSYLEIDRFYSAPLRLGGGTITFSHGKWPAPAPATVELVAGFPTTMGPVQAELTTPTGAAIVTTLVTAGQLPVCRFSKSGFGAGDRELAEIPNMLRLLLGADTDSRPAESPQSGFEWQEEEIDLLEANIDDMDPELFGHFVELALRKGALDAYWEPIHMKKNRPGLKLSVLCRSADRPRMAELFFRETTTLGVRWSSWRRGVLDREIKQVQTEHGKVAVKVGRFRGQIVSIAPEYESLKEIAEKAGIPLKRLRQIVFEKIGKLTDH